MRILEKLVDDVQEYREKFNKKNKKGNGNIRIQVGVTGSIIIEQYWNEHGKFDGWESKLYVTLKDLKYLQEKYFEIE
jgi:hypothetical protein